MHLQQHSHTGKGVCIPHSLIWLNDPPEFCDAAAQWLTKLAETCSDLCSHCSCPSDGALEGLGVHPIALHPMENPMVRSLQRHSYAPSLLFSWCPMLVPSTVYRITDYLCLLHRSSKMVTFGGQVLSGGLEMSSSA